MSTAHEKVASGTGAPRAQRQNKPSSTSGSLRTRYLILYNLVSATLWLVVLGRVLMLVPMVGFGHVYGGVGKFTQMTQTLALLEVFHSAIGLVRAPMTTTAMQVASRILLVWGVVEPFPFVASSRGYSSMLIAWSVTEVIRYSYFVFSLSGLSPGIITWFRYNTFYVLYPLGISSECWLIFNAISPAARVHRALAWFFQISLLIYVPGSYILFTHMITQRKKVMKVQKSA